jgi:hypothetical protein
MRLLGRRWFVATNPGRSVAGHRPPSRRPRVAKLTGLVSLTTKRVSPIEGVCSGGFQGIEPWARRRTRPARDFHPADFRPGTYTVPRRAAWGYQSGGPPRNVQESSTDGTTRRPRTSSCGPSNQTLAAVGTVSGRLRRGTDSLIERNQIGSSSVVTARADRGPCR